MSKMIIYLYCIIIPLVIPSVDSSSIRGRNHRNDLVPVMSSRADPSKKDNSLKIVSNEPFIIQLQMPDSSEDTGRNTRGRDKKKNRPSKKRDSKAKSLRKKHRIRREVEMPNFETKFQDIFTDDQKHKNGTSIRNSISREEIVKALTQITPKRNKTEDGLNKPKPQTTGGISYRFHLPPSDNVPIMKMVQSTNPKSDKRPHKYTSKDLKVDRERLEQKIKFLKKLLTKNDTNTPGDVLRVRRKTDTEKGGNKIAKMFLTLSAVNGLQDKKKYKCKRREALVGDNREEFWEKERRTAPMTKNSSSNEERYKVKKWIEFMKSKRSSRTCPCMPKGYVETEESDEFPLEQKLAKASPMETGSSEESSELTDLITKGGRKGYSKNRFTPDDRKRTKGKYVMPLDDLEVYRSRAKQILQNAEEILDKIKEEEEKRKSTPNILLSQLKELTSRIQGDPRNNENDLIRLIQKNLGWNSKTEDTTEGNAFVDNMKSLIVNPFEKAKALTDDNIKKISSYILKNLGSLQSSTEEDRVKEGIDEADEKNSRIYQGQEPLKKDELSSANLAKENYEESKGSDKLRTWAESISSIFGGGQQEDPQIKEEEMKKAKADEEQLQKRMEEMLKEQEKKINEYAEAPNLEPNSEEFQTPQTNKNADVDAPLPKKIKEELPVDDRPTADKPTLNGKNEQPFQSITLLSGDEGRGNEELTQMEKEPSGEVSDKLQAKDSVGEAIVESVKDDNSGADNEEEIKSSSNTAGKAEVEDGLTELNKQSSNAEDVEGNKEKLPETVAMENMQIIDSNAADINTEVRKSQENENDVTASELLEQIQQEQEQNLEDDQEMRKEMNNDEDSDLANEENVGADKVLNLEDLEDLKAEIQSREELENLEKARTEEDTDIKSSESEEVVQSKHDINYEGNESEETGDSSVTENSEDGKEREENDVIGSKHLKPVDEGKTQEDDLTRTEQKIPAEQDVKGDDSKKEDSNESKSKEENVMEKEGKLESNEKDDDKSEEQDNSKKPSGDQNAEEVLQLQNAGQENVESQTPEEFQKISNDDNIESTQGQTGPEETENSPSVNSLEKVELAVPSEDSQTEANKEVLGVAYPQEASGSNLSEAPPETNQEDTEPSLKAIQYPNNLDERAENEDETLQTENVDRESNEPREEEERENDDEITLRESKPEKQDIEESKENSDQDESVESTLRATNTGENEEQLEDGANENDEEPLMSVKEGKSAGKEESKESEGNEDAEDSVLAANPEETDNQDGEIQPKEEEETDLHENEESSTKDDIVQSSLEIKDVNQSAVEGGDGEDDETAVRAEHRADEDSDDEKTPLRAADNEEDMEEPSLREANPEMETEESPQRTAKSETPIQTDSQDESEESVEMPLRTTHIEESSKEMNDLGNGETPLRESNTDQTIMSGEEKVESSLNPEDKERSNKQSESQEQEEEDEDSQLRTTNEENMNEETNDDETLKAAKQDQESENEKLYEDTVQAIGPVEDAKEKSDDSKTDDVAVKAAAADLNNEVDEENVKEASSDGASLREAKPEKADLSSDDSLKQEEALLKEVKPDKADLSSEDNLKQDEALLREASPGDDLNNELGEIPENLKDKDEALLREAQVDEDPNAEVKLQQQLGDNNDEVSLKAENLEKAVNELDQNDLESLRTENKGETSQEGEDQETVKYETPFRVYETDRNEDYEDVASSRAENAGETYEDFEDEMPLKAVYPDNPSRRENMDDEEYDETPLRAAMDSSLKAENEDEISQQGIDQDVVKYETPFTASETDWNADYGDVASSRSEKAGETSEILEDESPLRSEVPTEVMNKEESEEFVNLRAESPRGMWHQENYDDDESYDDLYLKAANPLEELNTPRYKQGEEDENLSEENATPLRQSNNKPKTSYLKVPKSIREIMKNLKGADSGDTPSIQNLDPKKIDDMIGKIDEAEQENLIIDSDDVDCQKECKCAEKITTRSKNSGRYEIVKDFLHWMKDLQINRVLTDD